MVQISNLPTLNQICQGTFRDDCRQHFEEADNEFVRYAESDTFPNGIGRDRATDSGLPQILENYFIGLDPGAFGREPSTRYPLFSPDEEPRWDDQETIYSTVGTSGAADRYLRLTNLQLWIGENRWWLSRPGLRSSICTADELDMAPDEYRQKLDNEYFQGGKQGPHPARAHVYRHYLREYERLAQYARYRPNPEDLAHIARAEAPHGEYESYLADYYHFPSVHDDIDMSDTCFVSEHGLAETVNELADEIRDIDAELLQDDLTDEGRREGLELRRELERAIDREYRMARIERDESLRPLNRV